MIELKRLKLINWHNFENVTFDCARLTYMIGVNAVGKTTILDAIRYCLTTNRNFNALGNKKSGRTLQGSVHAKQRGENAYRRPGRTVAYIGAEFWDSVKRTNFVIAVRVESEGPMQELHPGDQTWYISEDGITLEKLLRTLRRYNLARPVGRLTGLDSRIEVFPTVLLALPDADLADAAAESSRTRSELALYERPEGESGTEDEE